MIPGLEIPDTHDGCALPPAVYTPGQVKSYRARNLRQIIQNRLKTKQRHETIADVAYAVGCSTSWVTQIAARRC